MDTLVVPPHPTRGEPQMNRKIFQISFAIILALFVSSAHPDGMCEMGTIILLQPNKVLSQRIPNVGALSDYIKQLNGAVSKFAGNHPIHKPVSGYVVLAVKPRNRSKAWLVFDPELSPELFNELINGIQTVPAPSVNIGVISFGENVQLWGSQMKNGHFSVPPEWNAVAKKNKRPMETSEIIDSLWK